MFRIFLVIISMRIVLTDEIRSSHKVFRIKPTSISQLSVLRELENEENDFMYWQSPRRVSMTADLMVSTNKLQYFSELMYANGIQYETFIDDVEAMVATSSNIKRRTRTSSFNWNTYHTLDEIYDWLTSLVARFPKKVKLIVGGKTFEGRLIKGVKLSFSKVAKPGVFIEGGIHAREWISPATVTYLLNELLTSTEKSVRKLARSYDWYIFPVFNPDGYAFSHENSTNVRNRFWRKSRSINPKSGRMQSCVGTDLNRNWGYHWISFRNKSSPCLDNFPGEKAFSEIETRSLSQFLSSISYKLFAYISLHSYSQFLLVPCTNKPGYENNVDDQIVIANKAVRALSMRYRTNYKVGRICEISGFKAGSSVDWVKGYLGLPMVFSYEMRDTGFYGFLLPDDLIVVNGEELLDSLVALFASGRKHGYF